MASTEGTVSFLDAVNARIEDIRDACTRCGRCVEACPIVSTQASHLNVLPKFKAELRSREFRAAAKAAAA
jgi:Fe-S oxidoreductase